MTKLLKSTALALAASSVAVTAMPAEAKPHHRHSQYRQYDNGGRYYNQGYQGYQGQQVWRGDNGNYYCRKRDGTTGLIIGGAAGALLGREVAGGGDRTLGTVLGAAAGALLGKSVAQNRTGGVVCK